MGAGSSAAAAAAIEYDTGPDTKVEISTVSDIAPGEADLMVKVSTPAGNGRQPSDIICVLDVSGSMGMEAKIQGASGASESHGLTLLDVAKHGVKTVFNTLNEYDRFALVSFNHQAQLQFALTPMDEEGHKAATTVCDGLYEGGTTNIWDGLRVAMDQFNEQMAADKANNQLGRFRHVMLLTDGEADNKTAIMPNLEAYRANLENRQLPCTINTFGFGYNLDSPLLCKLADQGSGAFSFIPDAGFVGTAFVNMMSQLLVTMGINVTLDLEILDENAKYNTEKMLWPCKGEAVNGKSLKIDLGTMQYGQSKDIIVPMTFAAASSGAVVAEAAAPEAAAPEAAAPEAAAAAEAASVGAVAAKYLSVKLSYEIRNGQKHTLPAVENPEGPLGKAANDLAKDQLVRLQFCAQIDKVVSTLGQNPLEQLVTDNGKAFQEFGEEKVKEMAEPSDYMTGLLADIQGQSLEAVSKREWYQKWGRHYLPSVSFAHKLQFCNNFKDPGVQFYGGDLFKDVQDKADEVFNNLPAPVASNPRSYGGSSNYSAPVSMAQYNNRDCG